MSILPIYRDAAFFEQNSSKKDCIARDIKDPPKSDGYVIEEKVLDLSNSKSKFFTVSVNGCILL